MKNIWSFKKFLLSLYRESLKKNIINKNINKFKIKT